MADFTKKRDALSTKAKWGMGIIAVLVLTPLSWVIAKGIFGLAAAGAAAGVAGIVGLALVHGTPVLSRKFANWKLAALKKEAERNPIETLQLQQISLEQGLEKEAKAITSFDAEVENFRGGLQAELEKGFPEAVKRGLPTLRNMERLLSFRRVKFKKAQKKVAERRRAVSEAEASYRVALASQRVTAASGEVQNSVLEQILEDIAFGAVDTAVNTSMAELRTAVMVEELPEDDKDLQVIDVQAKELLGNNPTETLDLNSLRIALEHPVER